MPEIVVSDTSVFILLDKIGELDLFRKTYKTITTTSEVSQEFGKVLPGWVLIKEVRNKTYQRHLEGKVDRGEASAIALALESENPLLILDDLKAKNWPLI